MEGFDLKNLLNPEHWLAMDSNSKWNVYENKPLRGGFYWIRDSGSYCEVPRKFFNVPTCENWEDSLIQVKDLIKD